MFMLATYQKMINYAADPIRCMLRVAARSARSTSFNRIIHQIHRIRRAGAISRATPVWPGVSRIDVGCRTPWIYRTVSVPRTHG